MKCEDRNHIYRLYTRDISTIILAFHQERGTEEEYLEYRRKFETPTTKQYDSPIELVLEINNYCNMLCKMCYRNYYTFKEKKDMPDILLDNILTEAKELKIPAIRIGASAEATLRFDLPYVLKKISTMNFLDFWMSTNGSQLDNKQLLEAIIDIPLTYLCVSLDAATPETYKKIRGGDLLKIEANINEFLKARDMKNKNLPILRVSFVNMIENFHEKQMFIDKWKDIADIIDIQTYFENNPNAKPSKDTLKEKGKDFQYSCKYPFKTIFIACDGELRPCSNTTYHVNDPIYLYKDYQTISDYWNSSWHHDFSTRIALNKYEKMCAECLWRVEFSK